MPKQIVAVTIPIYKSTLDKDELASLLQCIKILSGHPIIFFGPESLDIGVYKNACAGKIEFNIEYFDEDYFKDIDGYNKIMLSPFFYQRFKGFKFIFIYQLDAWVFKDDLLCWCSKSYDYIGAPWHQNMWSASVAKHATIPRKILTKLGYRRFNLVGNGGLSLRKVNSCIFNLKLFKKQADKFKMNEDYFFSFFINSYNPLFKIPTASLAFKFAFEVEPEKAYLLNDKQLPMGCHAWPKFKYFWKDFILE